MPKRGAEIQMNHENYEDPLPEEDAGEYVKADEGTIQTRKIIKARRRGPDVKSDSLTEPTVNPFKAFSFGNLASSSQPLFKPLDSKPLEERPVVAPVNSLTQLNATNSEIRAEVKSAVSSEVKTQNNEHARADIDSERQVVKAADSGSGSGSIAALTEQVTNIIPTNESSAPRRANGEFQVGCRTYLKHLRKLNEDLLNWLSTNLRSNPFCILSPMFADYTRHLEEIEHTYHIGPCVHHPADDKTQPQKADAQAELKTGLEGNAVAQVQQKGEPATVNTNQNGFSGLATLPKVEDLVAIAQDIPDGPLLTGSESLATRGFQFAFRDSAESAAQKAAPIFGGVTSQQQSNAASNAKEATQTEIAKPFRFGETSSVPAFSGAFVFGSNAVPNSNNASSTAGDFKFRFGAASSTTTTTTTTATVSSLSSNSSSFGNGGLFSGVFSFKPQAGLTSTQSSNAVPALSSFTFGAPPSSALTDSATKPKEPAAKEKQTNEADGEQQEEAEEADYEPPKAERVEQREADATFSVRCKLLYRRLGSNVPAASASNETDVLTKGVGTLSLKQVGTSEAGDVSQKPCDTDANSKLQLIVRAETALATVLLNLLVSRNSLLRLSMNESSKTVAFVTVPNPPFDEASRGKPAQLFVRVKTAEECKTLFDQLSRVVNAS